MLDNARHQQPAGLTLGWQAIDAHDQHQLRFTGAMKQRDDIAPVNLAQFENARKRTLDHHLDLDLDLVEWDRDRGGHRRKRRLARQKRARLDHRTLVRSISELRWCRWISVASKLCTRTVTTQPRGACSRKMCKEALYDRHDVPADVSHLVHYTTLGTLTSMLGVVEAAHEKYRLATPVGTGVLRKSAVVGGSVGYLRLYDTFSSNDPNEGAFFVNSADAKGSFRRRYNAVWSLFKDRSASPAYQTSLTYVGDVAEADNLVFWRTYGKDGTGCALAFPMTCFEGQSNVFRIRYGEGEAATCLDTLSELLEEYGKINGGTEFPKA